MQVILHTGTAGLQEEVCTRSLMQSRSIQIANKHIATMAWILEEALIWLV